jgi:hypothetical protein
MIPASHILSNLCREHLWVSLNPGAPLLHWFCQQPPLDPCPTADRCTTARSSESCQFPTCPAAPTPSQGDPMSSSPWDCWTLSLSAARSWGGDSSPQHVWILSPRTQLYPCMRRPVPVTIERRRRSPHIAVDSHLITVRLCNINPQFPSSRSVRLPSSPIPSSSICFVARLDTHLIPNPFVLYFFSSWL